MEALQTIFTAIMPVLAIVGAGYVLRARGAVGNEAQQSLMQVTLFVLMPCLVLDRVPHNAALNSGSLAWLAPAAGFLSITAGVIAARALAPLFGLTRGDNAPARTRTFAYCVSIYNYGYVAIPLCQTLVGREAVGVMLLFNAGIELAIWSVGLLVLTGKFERGAWRRLINPMTVGSVVALALNKTGIAPHMPHWVCDTFTMLGACSIPFGIFMVGMALPSLVREFKWREAGIEAAGAIFLRNLAVPALMATPVFAAAKGWLPWRIPKPLDAVIAIQAAMPAGIFPIVIAQHYGGCARTALRISAWTSLAAVLTLPFWLWVLADAFGSLFK